MSLGLRMRCRLLLAGLSVLGAAQAQAPAAGDPVVTAAPVSDRARRDAERPYFWIRQHAAEKPRAAEPPRRPASAPRAAAFAQLLDSAPPGAGQRPEGGGGEPPADTGPAAVATTPVALAPVLLPALVPADAVALAPQLAAPAERVPAAPLHALDAPEPDFPSSVLRKLRKGSVQVRIEVDAKGVVTAATVVTSPHPRLDEPAMQALRSWHFSPPGSPTQGLIEFHFDLDS